MSGKCSCNLLTNDLSSRMSPKMVVLALLISACHPTQVRPKLDGRDPIQGAAAQPEVLTIIPFQHYDNEGSVYIPAEIDGRRGTFYVDLGSTFPILNAPFWHLPAESLFRIGDESTIQLHRQRLGTVEHHFTDSDVSSVFAETKRYALARKSYGKANALVRMISADTTYPGQLGLVNFVGSESIFDYQNRRLILVRLDSLGRRTAAVPGFMPVDSMPLYHDPAGQHIAVMLRIGMAEQLFILDTGSSINILNPSLRKQFWTHISGSTLVTVDTLFVGRRGFVRIPFVEADVPGYGDLNLLGAPWMNAVGIWGLNLRTMRLYFYRASRGSAA